MRPRISAFLENTTNLFTCSGATLRCETPKISNRVQNDRKSKNFFFCFVASKTYLSPEFPLELCKKTKQVNKKVNVTIFRKELNCNNFFNLLLLSASIEFTNQLVVRDLGIFKVINKASLTSEVIRFAYL